MASSGTKFGLAYLDAGETPAYLERHSGKVLGVIGFGRTVALPVTPCAPVTVAIPVLGGKQSSIEVWTSDQPTTACEHLGICGTHDGKVLFGGVTLEQRPSETLEMLAEQAYMRIFS